MFPKDAIFDIFEIGYSTVNNDFEHVDMGLDVGLRWCKVSCLSKSHGARKQVQVLWREPLFPEHMTQNIHNRLTITSPETLHSLIHGD